MLDFSKLIDTKLDRLNYLLDEIEKDSLRPTNTVLISKRQYNQKYYYKRTIQNGKRHYSYIGNADSEKLKKIARASYKHALLQIVRNDIKVLKQLKNKYYPHDKAHVLKKISPAFSDITFDTAFDKVMEELVRWAADDYERNPKPFPDKIILAKDGTRVRSRAECIIYNALLDAGIPFRYDPVMYFKTRSPSGEIEVVSKCPDFQIMTPDGSYILIEHAGLLTSSQYTNDLASKIQLYLLNGYTLGYSLFVTSDDLDGGIDSKEIGKVIDLISMRFACL